MNYFLVHQHDAIAIEAVIKVTHELTKDGYKIKLTAEEFKAYVDPKRVVIIKNYP